MLTTRPLSGPSRSVLAGNTGRPANNFDRPWPVLPQTRPDGPAQPINFQSKGGPALDASMIENVEPTAWSEWDPVSFEQVVAQYQTRLYRFIFAIVGEAELARDLTQDTFLSAYRNLARRAQAAGSTEAEKSAGLPPPTTANNMSAWLYTIARNAAFSEMRRRKVVRFLPFLHKPAGQAEDDYDFLADTPLLEPGGSLEARILLQDELRLAMDKVGRDKLTALLLHMDGFSYKEICDITGDSLSSIKSQIYRAKESLRRALSAGQSASLLHAEEGRR